MTRRNPIRKTLSFDAKKASESITGDSRRQAEQTKRQYISMRLSKSMNEECTHFRDQVRESRLAFDARKNLLHEVVETTLLYLATVDIQNCQ